MELNQKILIIDHAKEIITMEVNHSIQVVSLQSKSFVVEEKQVQLINTIETNHAEEISVMKANKITFQNRLEEMEMLHVHKFQLRSDSEWKKNK